MPFFDASRIPAANHRGRVSRHNSSERHSPPKTTCAGIFLSVNLSGIRGRFWLEPRVARSSPVARDGTSLGAFGSLGHHGPRPATRASWAELRTWGDKVGRAPVYREACHTSCFSAKPRQCDCSPCREYPEEDFSPDPCFDKCIVTGDPHVEHSWRPGFENGFDFQPQGIWRLAKTDTCGGPVEVQAFFCHYFFTRLSA